MVGRKHFVLGLLVCALAALFSAPAGAQPGLNGQLYRLERGSTFSRGCFSPCLCAIFRTEEIRGTYALTFDHSDPLFDYYSVDDVNWIVTIGGQEVPITGSGTYRIGGKFALTHQMVLELAIGDENPQMFDSGLIPGGAEFPDIINIVVSIDGMRCFDTVIDIRSSLAGERFTTVDQGFYSGISEPRNVVIRSSEEWKRLWEEHTSIFSPPPPLPEVDFSRDMVIGVFLGTRPTGGFSVEILSVRHEGDQLVVEYAESSPGAGCIVLPVLTQPFHLIKVARSDDPVEFHGSVNTYDCN